MTSVLKKVAGFDGAYGSDPNADAAGDLTTDPAGGRSANGSAAIVIGAASGGLTLTGTPSQINVSPTGDFLLLTPPGRYVFYDTITDVSATAGPTHIYARALDPATGAPTGPEVTLNLPAPPAGQVDAPFYSNTQVQTLSDGSFLVLAETAATPTFPGIPGPPQTWSLDRYSSTGAFIATLNSASFPSVGISAPPSFFARPDGNYDLVTSSQATTGGTATLTAIVTTYTPTGAKVASAAAGSVSFSATTQAAAIGALEYFSPSGPSRFEELDSLVIDYLGAGESSKVAVTLPWTSTPTIYQAPPSTTLVTNEAVGVGGGFEADGSVVYAIVNGSFSSAVSTETLTVYHAVYNALTHTTTTTQLFSLSSVAPTAYFGPVSVLSNGDIEVNTYDPVSETTTGYPQYNSLIYAPSGQYLGSASGQVTTTASGGLIDVYAQNGDIYAQPLAYPDPTVPSPKIIGATYGQTGSETVRQWNLTGTGVAGATITVYDGTIELGTTLVAAKGTWAFATGEDNAALREFTATATIGGGTSAASAAWFEGALGNDIFAFASKTALDVPAQINGGGGTDTILLTAPATLADTNFAKVQAVQVLSLTGASSVTLGSNAAKAGLTTVNVGAGNTSVTDNSSKALTVNASALPAGATLTLKGSAPITVSALGGNLSAATDTGSLSVTLNQNGGAPVSQKVKIGSGADTVYSGYGADSITAASHSASDAFVYTSTSESINRGAHDTITGFLAGGAVNDLIDLSAINPHLNVAGALSGGAVAANSIAWVYSGTNAFVYVNDMSNALSTSSGNLMEITLAGVHSGLSASNFKA